jgi:pimeloyl-ACP methyl ester carboxylesterase
MLMIHGSPGSKGDFAGLELYLTDEFTTYAFDMPGFGDSSSWVGDYGYEAAARYLHEAALQLGLSDVVVTGFSWGGGVAIAFASKFPELVSELLLIGGVGVPEGFHTGAFFTEYARYIAAAPILLIYPGAIAGGLIPFAERFGFWRGFLDGDTRAAREMLSNLTVPLVVVHGRDDTVVGVRSARTHASLAPDSRLVWYDGGHGWIYNRYEELAAVVLAALGNSASGGEDRQ